MLRKFCHRGKIDVFDIGKRDLGIVAIVPLQLAGVVVARQIKLVKTRDDAVINNFNDVRLLLIFRHAVDDRSILGQGRRTKTFSITFDHFRQIKIHLITGAVLDKGHAVAVFDLAAH